MESELRSLLALLLFLTTVLSGPALAGWPNSGKRYPNLPCSGSSYTAPTYVQGGSAIANSTATTFTSSITTNKLLVFAIYHNATNKTVTSVTDTAGNTYRLASRSTPTSGVYGSELWYTFTTAAITSGSTTYTISGTSPNYGVAIAQTDNALGILDRANSLVSTSTTSYSVPTGGMACSKEIVLTVLLAQNYSNITDGAGFTLVSNPYVALDYKIVSSNASVSYAPSSSPAQVVTIALATFR